MTTSGATTESITELLLWAQALAVWMVAQYGLASDPSSYQEVRDLKKGGIYQRWKTAVWIRAVVVSATLFALPGTSMAGLLPRVGLAVIGLTFSAILPFGRQHLALYQSSREGQHDEASQNPGQRRGIWVAEWEIAVVFTYTGLSAALIFISDLGGGGPVVMLPLSPDRLSVLCIFVAIWMTLGRGCAYVVRGVLNKVGTFPVQHSGSSDDSAADVSGLDAQEFNRGRMIGVVERLLLALFMSVQAYQAVGLLIAAKGLIRSKDLENRDFAEYFLIGTLASTLLAIAAGVLVQGVIAWFW